MNGTDQAIQDIFVLSLFLVAVVYWLGFTTDLNSVKSAVTSLILVGTGRNQNGQFANYPAPAKG